MEARLARLEEWDAELIKAKARRRRFAPHHVARLHRMRAFRRDYLPEVRAHADSAARQMTPLTADELEEVQRSWNRAVNGARKIKF